MLALAIESVGNRWFSRGFRPYSSFLVQCYSEAKAALALTIATGGTVKAWANAHDVPERTAYTWARSPEVRNRVRRIRQRAIDRAIGRLSQHASAAADQIARLAKDALSEAVRFQAARAVLADLMTVSNYAALEERITELERARKEAS